MIKILKPGHGDFKEAFCKYCGCEFAYQRWDIEVFSFSDGEYYFLEVECPTCYKKVRLGKIAAEEWFKNGVEGKLC